jgi:O-antigen/teichoic acid export membrane protein
MVPALNLLISRMLLTLAVIIAAVSTGNMAVMATAFFAVTIASSIAQWALWRRLTPEPRLSLSLASARVARLFVSECAPFAVWYFAMLLITGLDLVIVARFDHAMVPYYAAAATLVLFVSGIIQAVCSASLPVAARLVADERAADLNALVHRVTRVSIWLGWLMAAPLIVSGEFVLRVWIGDSYARTAAPFLILLVLANAIRMSVLPFVIAVTAAGSAQADSYATGGGSVEDRREPGFMLVLRCARGCNRYTDWESDRCVRGSLAARAMANPAADSLRRVFFRSCMARGTSLARSHRAAAGAAS